MENNKIPKSHIINVLSKIFITKEIEVPKGIDRKGLHEIVTNYFNELTELRKYEKSLEIKENKDVLKKFIETKYPNSLVDSTKGEFVKYRHSLMYLINKFKPYFGNITLAEIHGLFYIGKTKDHATVIYGIDNVRKWKTINGYDKELELFNEVEKEFVKNFDFANKNKEKDTKVENNY